MAEASKPWGFWHGGRRIGRRTTRESAIRAMDDFIRWGSAAVINTDTGEKWKRRGGTWFKARDCWPHKQGETG